MNTRKGFKLLSIIRESKAFQDYLSTHEEIWLKQEKQKQQSRVPGIEKDTTPTPQLALTRDDLGGPQGVQRLRQSTRPEADLRRLIAQAEKDRDFDRAARIQQFTKEFDLQRSEITAGLRQQYRDSNTVSQTVMSDEYPQKLDQSKYLVPLQTLQAQQPSPDQNRTIRKNADGSISAQISGPATGEYANVVQSARDRVNSLRKSSPNDPLIQQLDQQLDQLKQVGQDQDMDPSQKEARKTPIYSQLAALLKKEPGTPETSIQGTATADQGTLDQRVDNQVSQLQNTPPTQEVQRDKKADRETDLENIRKDLEDLGVLKTKSSVRQTQEPTEDEVDDPQSATTKARSTVRRGRGKGKVGLGGLGNRRVKKDSKQNKLKPFGNKAASDRNLESQVEVASKRIASIRSKMKDLINQLKKEKNPVIKERIKKMMDNLDRQLGVAYITMERLKGVSGLTTQINTDTYNNLRDVFRGAEQASIEASEVTNSYPAVLKAAGKVKAQQGYTTLDQFFSDELQAKREAAEQRKENTPAPQVKTTNTKPTDDELFEKAMEEEDFDKAQALMDDIDDEIQEILNEPEEVEEPKKPAFDPYAEMDRLNAQDEVKAKAKVDKERKARQRRNRKSDAKPLSPMQAAETYTKAIGELRDKAKTAKGPEKRNLEMGMSLLKKAMNERMGTTVSKTEPYKFNYKDSIEHLDKTPEVQKLVQNVDAATQDGTESLEDLIDKVEDQTKMLTKDERYYLGLVLSQAFKNQESVLLDAFSDPKKPKSKKLMRRMIRKVESLGKQRPIEADPESKMSGEDSFVQLSTDSENPDGNIHVDTLNIPGDNTPAGLKGNEDRRTADSEEQYTTPRRIKTGDDLADSIFQYLVRGKNKKSMPDDDKAVINVIKKFALNQRIDDDEIPHDGSLDVDFQTAPAIDDIRKDLEYRGGKNLRPGDVKRLEDAMRTRTKEREERKKKDKDESGSLGNFLEWFKYAFSKTAESDPQWIYEMAHIGQWAKEVNEACKNRRRLLESKTYLYESQRRCWEEKPIHSMVQRLEEEIWHYTGKGGYSSLIEFFDQYDNLDSDQRLQYRISEVEFKARNHTWLISEKLTVCLGNMMNLTEGIKVPTNPVNTRINQDNVESQSTDFYQALMEVSTEESDKLAQKTSDESAKNSHRSYALKHRRANQVRKAKTRQMEYAEGRQLLSLKEFKRR